MNQLSQLLILYLTMPSSDFYVVKILGKTSDPALEPCQLDALSLGAVDVLGQQVDVTLRQIVIRGISNVQVARNADGSADVEVVGDTVTFVAVRPNTEAPPANVPTDLGIDAQLELVVGGTPSPAIPITVTVKQGTLTGVFVATGDPARPETVDITFTSATIASQPSPDNIQFDLSQFRSFLRAAVEGYLQQASTLASLIDRLNAELAKPAVLAALGKSGTDAVRAALGQLVT